MAAGQTLTMQTANDHGVVNVTLRNHGTVQWTGGRLLYQGGNNTVINESDGTWNVAGRESGGRVRGTAVHQRGAAAQDGQRAAHRRGNIHEHGHHRRRCG